MEEPKINEKDPFMEAVYNNNLEEMFNRMTLKLHVFKNNLNKMIGLMRSERNALLMRDALYNALQDIQVGHELLEIPDINAPIKPDNFEKETVLSSLEIQDTNAPIKPDNIEKETVRSSTVKQSMIPISNAGFTPTPMWTPLKPSVKKQKAEDIPTKINPKEEETPTKMNLNEDTSTKMNPNEEDIPTKMNPNEDDFFLKDEPSYTFRPAVFFPIKMKPNPKDSLPKGEIRTYREAIIPIPISVFLETPDGSSPMPKKLKLINASRSLSAPNIKSKKW